MTLTPYPTKVISNVSSLVKSIVDQYIVKPTGGQSSIGVSGFIFDIIADEEIVLQSQITDHYVEDNYAVQDHIGLQAERFTLRGYVGELSDYIPNSALNVLTSIQSLNSVASFMPVFTAQATQLYTKIAANASKVGQVLNQAKNIYDIFTNYNTTANKQQKAYNYFYQLWSTRQLVTVETPFNKMDNMAIESVRARQTGDSKTISDFTVTFKRIRTTTVTYMGTSAQASQYPFATGTAYKPINYTNVEYAIAKGRAGEAVATNVFKGSSAGKSVLQGDVLATRQVSIDVQVDGPFCSGGGHGPIGGGGW